MIAVLNGSESLTIELSAAKTTLDADWSLLWSGGNPGPANPTGQTNGATAVNLLAGGSEAVRVVQSLLLHNTDTGEITATIKQITAAGTRTRLKRTIEVGGSLLWNDRGVNLYDAVGRLMNVQATVKLDAKKFVAADVVMATAATWADITGLTQALQSGKKYAVEAHLFHVNDATTTGSQFGYNIGAAPTLALFGNHSGVTNSVTAGAQAIGTATARDTAITAQTTGSTGITHTVIAGYIQPSADGTFALRGTSEVTVAAGLTIKAGSWMRIWELDA